LDCFPALPSRQNALNLILPLLCAYLLEATNKRTTNIYTVVSSEVFRILFI
jgi:hypothetical protein